MLLCEIAGNNITNIGGYKFVETNHAEARKIQRANGVTPEQVNDMFKQLARRTDKLLKAGNELKDVLLFSKSINQGIVLKFLPNAKEFIIKTWLPAGFNYNPKSKDTSRIMLEHLEVFLIEI